MKNILLQIALLPLRMACLAILLALSLVLPAEAQLVLDGRPAPIPATEAFQLDVVERNDGSRALTWTIAQGYYLYRDYLSAETIDGKSVSLTTEPGLRKDDPTFGSVEVYYDVARAEMASASGPVTITFQGCQEDGICYPPVTQTLSALDSAPDAASQSPANNAFGAATDNTQTTGGSPGLTLAQNEGVIEGLQARGGTILVLAGFFAFGLLLAFTPCMFPMFPILTGLLSGQGKRLTARRGFVVSGIYVLAMAGAFGLLGIAAAWSGQNLQMVLQSPIAIYLAAAAFATLALSMFGLFEMQLPAAWNKRLSSVGGSSGGTYGGAAALGFSSALIMGPCVTAPLAGALLYIAGTGDVTLGAAALFTLGLGQGIPLLIVGTLGARVLPKAGAWMNGVKRLFGFIFLGMAIWLIGRLIAGPGILALWSLLLIGGGIFFGAMDLLYADAGPVRRAVKTASVFSMIAGAIMLVGAAIGGNDPLRPLDRLRASAETAKHPIEFVAATTMQSLQTALAASPKTPTLVYVTADWCVTCRVIEREVWADATVQTALSEMSVIAADVSDFGAEGQAMLDQLGAVGPPTMIFLTRESVEVPNTRIVGDTNAEDVVASAEALR